jgi:hypothetical protein
MTIRACARCRFAVKFVPAGQIQSQLQCRWGPPAVLVLPAPPKVPGQMSLNIVAMPPPLPDTHWCHQFIPLPEGSSLPIESQNVQNPVTGTLSG